MDVTEFQLSYLKSVLKDGAVKVLHSICQQIRKAQQWSQDWKRSVLIPIPKKGNAKECSNYHTVALILHTSKVMLKILQSRLQQYLNHELPDVKLDLEKTEEPEIKLPTFILSWRKQGNYKKKIYFFFIVYAKAFDCVDHSRLWRILNEKGIPDHPICLLRNLYAGHKGTVRTGHGTTE